MSDAFSVTDLFGELDRLQQQMASMLGDFPSSLRSQHWRTFPQINIGTTDDTIEVVAFAPGLKPDEIEVSIDKSLLTISGERKAPESDAQTKVYLRERFAGKFRRVVELPQNADPDKVQARYANGCLCISVGKLESSKPRAITIQ